MQRRRTLFEKAIKGEFQTDDIVSNLKRCKEISNDVSVTDLLSPTSKHIGLFAELLYRIQNMPELENVDSPEMLFDSSTAYWG